VARPEGLAVAVQTRPHDAQDGAGKQDGAGHIAADEGDGEDRGQNGKGRRGGMGQRSEEGGDGAGESREHERGEAECPDAGAGLSVGQAAPPGARLFPSRCRASLSCAMAPSFTAGNTCPVSLPLSEGAHRTSPGHAR